MIIAIPPGARCQYEGCKLSATHIACGKEWDEYGKVRGHPVPNFYCHEHARAVVNEDWGGEYEATCPNCGCMFGVDH